MAEAAFQFLLERCVEWLSTKMQQLLHGYDVDDKVSSLQEKKDWLSAYLKDVDDRSIDNERAKVWVNTMRDIAYDAEDVIDDFIYNAQARETSKYLLIRSIISNADAAKKIDAVISRFHKAINMKRDFGIDSFVASASHRGERIPSVVEELHVVGLDDDASILAKQLAQGATWRSVVSIVGMGGVGKTTLAKKLYNNSDIKKQFDHHAWVFVSQDYSPKEILKGIIKSIVSQKKKDVQLVEKMPESELGLEFPKQYLEGNKELLVADDVLSIEPIKSEPQQHLKRKRESWVLDDNMSADSWVLDDNMSADELQKRLHELLEGKRYLVVLDDMWKKEAWDILKGAFPMGQIRSRILLTTRNKDVALHADAQGFLHDMRFLSEADSWKLFCSKAFVRDSSRSCPANLENYGRQIVGKCSGLPLAIVMLGGLLSTKGNHPLQWAKVLERVHCRVRPDENQGQNQIVGILALSYYDLPYHLKSCFMYLGAFPEDSEIRASTLIKMWAAEGFIPQEEYETIEDAAEDCLNELVNRSMVQMAKTSSYGTVKTCRVHDLLRDLSISKSKEANFLECYAKDKRISTTTKARRLAVAHRDLRDAIDWNHMAKQLRSILQFPTDTSSLTQPPIIHKNFRYLRVLNLHAVKITSRYFSDIASLVHLRYLGLRNTRVEHPPSTVSDLYNLQTLDIRNTNTIVHPQDIWKLKRLRHLRTENNNFDEPEGAASSHFTGPEDHSQLDVLNLMTLTGVRAEDWVEKGLEKLTNLTKLSISGDFSLYNNFFSNVEFACLKSLKLIANINGYIPSLSCFLRNHHLYSMHLRGPMEKASHPHQAPPNLTKLTLIDSCLDQELLPTIEMLQNLRILTMGKSSYIENKMVFSARGFPSLQVLRLHDLEELSEWIVEEGAMPALRRLEICSCRRLRSLPEGLQRLTNLQELKIRAPSHSLKLRLEEDDGYGWYEI